MSLLNFFIISPLVVLTTRLLKLFSVENVYNRSINFFPSIFLKVATFNEILITHWNSRIQFLPKILINVSRLYFCEFTLYLHLSGFSFRRQLEAAGQPRDAVFVEVPTFQLAESKQKCKCYGRDPSDKRCYQTGPAVLSGQRERR